MPMTFLRIPNFALALSVVAAACVSTASGAVAAQQSKPSPRPVIAQVQSPAMRPGAIFRSGVRQTADGALEYPFARKPDPRVICKPLYVCDVELQSGEQILNLAIGDSLRWVIAAAGSGPGGSVPHVFVKPTEAHLNTNLVITTSKRVYYIALASENVAVSPRISFSYPGDEEAAAAARLAEQRAEQDDAARTLPLLPPESLDYNYKVGGAAVISPQRVYNDGVHTYIEYATLPDDLPVVYAIAPDGSNKIVNYRLKGSTFIVDSVPRGFDLVLNAGTGKRDRGELRCNIRHK